MASELNTAISMVSASITGISKNSENNKIIVEKIIQVSYEMEKMSQELNNIVNLYRV